MARDDDFDRSVFVNCPLDEDYDLILQAVLFCLVRFGLKPRIATERSDAGEPRISKILDLIQRSATGLLGCQVFWGIGAARVLVDYEDCQGWHIGRQRDRGFSDDDIRDYSTAELLRNMIDWRDN